MPTSPPPTNFGQTRVIFVAKKRLWGGGGLAFWFHQQTATEMPAMSVLTVPRDGLRPPGTRVAVALIVHLQVGGTPPLWCSTHPSWGGNNREMFTEASMRTPQEMQRSRNVILKTRVCANSPHPDPHPPHPHATPPRLRPHPYPNPHPHPHPPIWNRCNMVPQTPPISFGFGHSFLPQPSSNLVELHNSLPN